jgi:hypothetical protein
MTAVHQLDPALPPAAVYARLDPAVRKLITAAKTLYQGDWDDCAEDIRRRRAGKPYLFRIDSGLPDDLEWIGRLKAYEATRGERFEAAEAITSEHAREDHR